MARTVDPSGDASYTAVTVELQSATRRGLRVRQFLLTAVLVTPLIFAIATAPPFSAEARAQGASRMFGPNFPALAGSDTIGPTRSGNSITIPSRWACGSTVTNVIDLSNQDSSGRFLTAARTNGVHRQSVTTTSIVNGSPQQFSYLETKNGATNGTGTITLTDANSDGVVDGVLFTGAVSGSLSLAFSSDHNYVSAPWAEVSALGVDTTATCAGAVPQIWIPLADTNGDGVGDSIVMDLDGNGQADPDVLPGPPVVVPAVPTMGPVARLILMALISLAGWWFLSRRRSGSSGTPAVSHP